MAANPGSSSANPAFAQYCEAIFELAEDEVGVIQARIAERLGVSRPAVSEMVRRLEGEGLVALDGQISLTPAGLRLAEGTVRQHRLVERMLTDLLGLPWSEAHVEASRWDVVLSPEVEAAITDALGDPTTCPHGNPIPGSAYAPQRTVVLGELSPGAHFQVTRIPEELEFTPGLLPFLEQAAVTPGRCGTVEAVSPDGTITVVVGERPVGIGPFAAARILVLPTVG